jgi:uncharacterized OsmC-like protein
MKGVVNIPMDKFAVKARSENPTKTVAEARGFNIILDEPEDLGGTNEGPNPVEYILAALSGCLNVLGHMVAGEMGFNLRGLEFELEGDLNIDKCTGKNTKDRAGYKEIRVTVKPDTDADQTTLDKWLKAIELRCPVSDNIANTTPVKISLEVLELIS